MIRHRCDQMTKDEGCHNYDGGWDFVQTHELQIYGINYCPKCGVKLE